VSIKKFLCVFNIKFITKRVFQIFPILRTNGVAPFYNLFIERPAYIPVVICNITWVVLVVCIDAFNVVVSFVKNKLLKKLPIINNYV